MKKTMFVLLLGATFIPTATVAHDTTTTYSNRGACEAASAAMSQDEKDWLLDIGAEFFDTTGDVSSFLSRAFTCDVYEGQYRITDHVEEVLGSDWFQQRKH